MSCLPSSISILVPPNHMSRNPSIRIRIHLIQYHKQQIKTTQQRVRQSNILLDPTPTIILSINRVSSCQHRTPRIQTSMQPSLGNSHSLLLHSLMDSNTIILRHLIKLIHTHQPPIRQHHRPRLKTTLPCIRIRRHCRSQPHTRTSPPSRTNRQRRNPHRTPQQLTLGRTRISNHQNINISPQMCPILQILLYPTQQLQRQRLLNHTMSMYTRTHTPSQHIQNILPLTQLTNRPDIPHGKDQSCIRIPSNNLNIIDQHHSLEHTTCRSLPSRSRRG
mmetsp:Transcript_25427/g.41320  ORF Transcript_25427/g.41320 Transcript_25427/m.41320 type:complete len:276 (+) Transcript_25427:345-1172(+)